MSDRLIRLVVGGLRSAVNEHGPITENFIGSAAKRVVNQLTAACRRQAPLSVAWDDVPKEVRTPLALLVQHWSWLLPFWVYQLNVSFHEQDGGDEGVTLAQGGRPEYREAVLKVYPWWLRLPDDEREVALVHEFLHLPWTPYVDAVDAVVAATYPDNDTAAEMVRLRLNEKIESAVQDLAWSMVKRAAP